MLWRFHQLQKQHNKITTDSFHQGSKYPTIHKICIVIRYKNTIHRYVSLCIAVISISVVSILRYISRYQTRRPFTNTYLTLYPKNLVSYDTIRKHPSLICILLCIPNQCSSSSYFSVYQRRFLFFFFNKVVL